MNSYEKNDSTEKKTVAHKIVVYKIGLTKRDTEQFAFVYMWPRQI